jgi:hypothetical protein
MTLNTIHCADAVRHMSVNVGIQPLRCTDSHGHCPPERVDLPKLQTCPALAGEDYAPEHFDPDAANAAVAAI